MRKRSYSDDHENRIRRLERNVKANLGTVRVFGSVGGGVAGYCVLGPYTKDFAEVIGETWHGIDLAARLASNYFRNEDSADKYAGRIDASVREEYFSNRKNEHALVDASRESLEAMQRASLKVPGVESKPVKGLRGVKGWIFEKTKGLGRSEERKEEAKIQNSDDYTENYNDLARLRMSAVERRELLKVEIVGQSRKLEQNEYNTGKVDERGLKILENLIREYSNISDVLSKIGKLDIREINEGVLNKRYEEVVSDAENYGIVPYNAEGWGDAGVMGATVLGIYVGYKISQPIARIANGIYNIGKDIVLGTTKLGKIVVSGIKRKKLNSEEGSDKHGN